MITAWDVVVVGGGAAAACVLASRLSETADRSGRGAAATLID